MNKTKVLIRIIAGIYLLYSSFSLGKAVLSGETEEIAIFIFAIAFVIFGAFFVITGIRDMRKISAMERQEAKEAEEAAAEENTAITEEPESQPKKSIAERARMTANISDDEEKDGE